jgi:hypothetical protein
VIFWELKVWNLRVLVGTLFLVGTGCLLDVLSHGGRRVSSGLFF